MKSDKDLQVGSLLDGSVDAKSLFFAFRLLGGPPLGQPEDATNMVLNQCYQNEMKITRSKGATYPCSAASTMTGDKGLVMTNKFLSVKLFD